MTDLSVYQRASVRMLEDPEKFFEFLHRRLSQRMEQMALAMDDGACASISDGAYAREVYFQFLPYSRLIFDLLSLSRGFRPLTPEFESLLLDVFEVA